MRQQTRNQSWTNKRSKSETVCFVWVVKLFGLLVIMFSYFVCLFVSLFASLFVTLALCQLCVGSFVVVCFIVESSGMFCLVVCLFVCISLLL